MRESCPAPASAAEVSDEARDSGTSRPRNPLADGAEIRVGKNVRPESIAPAQQVGAPVPRPRPDAAPGCTRETRRAAWIVVESLYTTVDRDSSHVGARNRVAEQPVP